MTVGQLLDDIRHRYLTQFRRIISQVRRERMEAWVEPACRDEDGALAREGPLGLPMRLDLAAVADGEVKSAIRVDSDSLLTFEPIDFEWSAQIPARLAPFYWDDCHVQVTGIHHPADWSHLQSWFEKWFDAEDTHPLNSDGFSEVIHFLSDPKAEGAATIFQIDFGSAPVEAFEELLDALRCSGATKIQIGKDQNN
jgi:hypothetical protein